ncbi:MAG: cyclic pyranopterin monophosphate synthase MoaC [bacterium]
MIDISFKNYTLREATACATLETDHQTIQLIKENKIPKGNLFEISKSVGITAAKYTP